MRADDERDTAPMMWVRLSVEEFGRVVHVAAVEAVTPADVLRKALEAYLQKREAARQPRLRGLHTA